VVQLVKDMERPAVALVIILVTVTIAACGRGPHADEVRHSVQAQLDHAFGERIVEIDRLKLAGGTPLKERGGRLVYFNAALKLTKDYDFTRWSAHSVASFGALLGAGPKGVFGLEPDGNAAGSTLRVYGTAAFIPSNGRWQMVPRAPPVATEVPVPAAAVGSVVRPVPREVPPPSPAEEALDRLASLLHEPPAVSSGPAERNAILQEVFEQAYQVARRRIQQRAELISIAGGPGGGAYEEAMRALQSRAAGAGTELELLSTEGSVANVRMLADRSVEFALMQNDIARSAYLGRGRFAGQPQSGLRAVASLFPEPVHIVARADSGIANITDLRGKRVSLGPEGSGTRSNAMTILSLNGVALETLASISALTIRDAAAALREGKLDALFATLHAPAAELQRLASRTSLTWIPIGPSKEMLDGGLIPLTLPPRTYPDQRAPLPTVAAAAIVVTREDVPDQQIETLLKLLFVSRGGSAHSAAVSQIGVRTAREGVTIPWSNIAEAWLSARGGAATVSDASRDTQGSSSR
jgi:TRAP transporter TAXI family solute receptor